MTLCFSLSTPILVCPALFHGLLWDSEAGKKIPVLLSEGSSESALWAGLSRSNRTSGARCSRATAERPWKQGHGVSLSRFGSQSLETPTDFTVEKAGSGLTEEERLMNFELKRGAQQS